MVRQAEHVSDCAEKDAEQRRRRKVTGWFTKGNGVCALCRCGPGKRCTRLQRKEHEQGYVHKLLHQQYLNAFEEMTAEIYERILREQAVRKVEEVRKLKSGMLGPLFILAPGKDPAAWLAAPIDASEIKAALFDQACRNGLDPCGELATPECREAIKRHVRCVQRAILLKAAQASLAAQGDESRAATAWRVCAAYV
jgi:hypothetical protein